MRNYVITSDVRHLEEAYNEVKLHSNPHKEIGIQNRRDVQAEMFSSTDCPLYVKPCDGTFPEGEFSLEVIVGDGVVPRDAPGPKIFEGEYYIWRTQADRRVRKEHAKLDGRVFSIQSPPHVGRPGEDYNCRCYAEHMIPTWVNIQENKYSNDTKKLWYLIRDIKESIKSYRDYHDNNNHRA